ncbi:tRNA-dihydrouridine synthase 3 [Komagataella kurtzmanii]|nr:tRNA-dihydrouridine synthase 3 [Komagataella kurtzmanii]
MSDKRTAEETLQDTTKKVHIEQPSNDSKSVHDHDHFAKGVTPIKKEFLVSTDKQVVYADEESSLDRLNGSEKPQAKKSKKKRGQNKDRDLKQTKEAVKLCPSLVDPETPKECRFGADACRFTHNIEEYLNSKPQDVQGVCPVFAAIGYCPNGLKCRWLSSHYKSGKLIKDEILCDKVSKVDYEVNHISQNAKTDLSRKKFQFDTADKMILFLDSKVQVHDKTKQELQKENANNYVEPPFKVSEKKKLNVKNAKIVSPLTTVGNLPYRRLMKTLGADITYSEMALSLPLIQGTNSEWALPKAHSSEYPGFGVQIATSKHWTGAKAAEAIAKLTPQVSEINLNCGCPIDLLYRQGQGSALMEQPPKLLRVLKGMNYCSGEIPVTFKLRIGTRDNHPLAENLVKRVCEEGDIGCVTLHGRTRQQRYTKEADWSYISKVGQVVRDYNHNQLDDKEQSDRDPIYFVGNGDCFTHEDWHKAVSDPNIDSVMVARGALIKPWIFEETNSEQYIDKSATERLALLEQYSKFALQHWGSDDYGVNTARRFMCEFMSFTHRYVPVGIMERLPPKLNQRPPTWKGRNELETLLGSPDYRDWIKITEMFLGPTTEGFSFTPKHRSNSYKS